MDTTNENPESLVPAAPEIPAPKLPAKLPDGPDSVFDEAFHNVQRLAKLFVASGMFPDVKNMAQAGVKIVAGQELGMTPMRAMRNLFIVDDKIAMMTIEFAARIKESREYDYEVLESTAEGCTVRFTKNGKALTPTSTFTIADAKRAGLTHKKNWVNYPQSMLFWRALAIGARMHCPHLFIGAPYIPEELGAETDEKGTVVTVTNPANDLNAKFKARKAAATQPEETPEKKEPTPEELEAEVAAIEQQLAR